MALPLVVDGNNVMGAAADGWWRDRAGAARRLVARLQDWAATADRPVTVVFDQPVLDPPDGPATVLHATRRGRDAADDRIVELLDERCSPHEVVTSDRDLADRVRRRGHQVTGAGTFLRQLP